MGFLFRFLNVAVRLFHNRKERNATPMSI